MGKFCLWMLFLLNTTNIFGKGETTFEFGSKRSRIPCSTFENIQEVLYPSISQGHGLQCDCEEMQEFSKVCKKISDNHELDRCMEDQLRPHIYDFF